MDPEQRHRQRRLIAAACAFILLVAAGGAAYAYISSAPSRAERQFQTGMLLMGPGTYPDAIARFDQAINITPDAANYYLERGLAHQALLQTDAAVADLQKALDLDPNLAPAYNALGAIYRERGDNKRALDNLSKSIQLGATVDGYYQRGQIYEALGEHQKAIGDYDQSIAVERNAPYVYRARALAKHNVGDLAGAESDNKTADNIEHR
jgi:tetratricopeptide (TPR) repeat protein